ncbi:hypothetical protein H0N96_00605, partial [Candidatus Micrarchaeota archaeon]|nr:hypothetical protein [Candidatus Micrarchaeota archaeon]
GILTTMEAEVISSNLSGIFVDIKPFVSVETQQSAELAAKIAAKKARVPLDGKTVLFKIIANAEVVDGPSGGTALALLAYSEFMNKSRLLRSDLAITGSIEQDGSVGKIGGVTEKVKAAIQAGGIMLFIVPSGQSRQDGTDLNQLGAANGMQVIETDDLNEIIALAFTPKGSHVAQPVHANLPLALENAPAVSPEAQQMRGLAEQEIKRLENISKTLGERVNAVVQNADNGSEVKRVKEANDAALNTTRYLLSKDYFYSAANLAFVTETNSEGFLLENITKAELTALLDKLQAELQPSFEQKFSTSFNKATLENWEWIAGAEARYEWARKKAAEVRVKLAISKNSTALKELIVDYLSARNWLHTADSMSTIAGSTAGSGPLANETNARANALRIIQAANESISSISEQEAEWHLQAAEQSFQDGNYFGASIDACFALSFARAQEKALDAIGEDFNALIENASGFEKRAGVWAQLYFVHSLYLKMEGKRTREFDYYLNALKLQELSTCLTANSNDFKTVLTDPTALTDGVENGTLGASVGATASEGTPEPGYNIQIVQESNGEKLFLALDIILIILLAATAVLIYRLRKREREAAKPLLKGKGKKKVF